MITPDYSLLDDVGLNLHTVFAIDRLPSKIRARLDSEQRYRQLILVGNGGRTLWSSILAEGIVSPDPIDDFSVRKVRQWLASQAAGRRHEFVYPGARMIGLQTLGTLAGWHFASPFMVGINEQWGSWFAYRAVVLADTDFEVPRPVAGASPCNRCTARFCVDACPGVAMTDSGFDLQKCVSHRKLSGSACRASCQARLACPVGSEHRYHGDQIRHSYSISMQLIERYC
jgi:hypothetical protein